VEEALKA